MTTPGQPSASPQVRCYVCKSDIPTPVTDFFYFDEHNAERSLPPGGTTDPLQPALFRCPNGHVLPADYIRNSPPIVIGIVGSPGTGKSTLLAMMVHALDEGKLRGLGFRAVPLLLDQHEEYRTSTVELLQRHRRQLMGTAPAAEDINLADGVLLVGVDGVRQPVVFMDVGGETFLNAASRNWVDITRFMQAFTALIFVVDASRLVAEGSYDDPSFRLIPNRINASSGQAEAYLDQPAAIVLTKADILRFEPPVAHWLGEEITKGLVDPERIYAESQDIYAYLHQRDAGWALEPFDVFRRCTLHAVSATGSNAVKAASEGMDHPAAGDGEYLHPLRPRRVLEPLIAILAMAGVIKDPNAALIGRWAP